MNTPIRHGELILKPVEALPADAKLEKTVKSEVLAHSETGHHHVLESLTDFKVYTITGKTYIELEKEANLVHKKTGKYVHAPHKVKPSVYEVIIKKEFNYFSGLLERVRD